MSEPRRRRPGPGALWTGAGLLALLTPTTLFWAVDAQVVEPVAAGVEGVVFDSTRGSPLADADVYLWGTPHRAVTDARGAFELGEVEPGRYTVIFFHPRLAELGVSPGGAEIEARAGERARVSLAVPSVQTVLAAQCALEEPGEGAFLGGVPVIGRVTDGVTGAPRPESRVTLSWPRSGAVPSGSLQVLTGEGGWFSACAVPSAVAVAVVARSDGRSSLWREVEFGQERPGRLDLGLRELRPARLSGRVLDVAADSAVGGVEVSLRGTELAAVTDDDGTFLLQDVPPGDHTLVVRHPPYEPLEQGVELGSGIRADVVVRLVEGAMVLAPLEVTVERTTQTERAMGGFVVGRERIEAVASRVRDLADILREQRVSGLIVRRSGASGACVGFTTGQVRMTPNRRCVPLTVFIDGVRAPDPSAAFLIPAEAIDHLILYRPIEAGNLFGARSANGVLEIFTRR